MSSIILAILFGFSLATSSSIRRSPFDNLSAQRYKIWANVAYSYVRNISCDVAFFTVPDQCYQMKQRPREQMNVYSAEAGGNHRKLLAVLPDGTLSRSGAHDGVVVIDPFPSASFGHLVLVFFIDRLERSPCEFYGGIFIENHNDCLRLALKDGCHNLFTRQELYQSYVHRHASRKIHKCEIDFLPFVHEVTGNHPTIPLMNAQKLQCRDVKGFARCLQSASDGTTRVTRDSSEERTKKRCRLFEICDHAVIVHGQWGHVTGRRGDFGLLQSTKRMLAKNGFTDENIEVFYKNGLPDDDGDYDYNQQRRNENTSLPMRSASNKARLRSHLRLLCSSLHCADTLVVFLRGPAMYDGSLLLYDTNADGTASQDEVYTVGEILHDFSNCLARRVLVVADYSYSGRLTTALQKHRSSGNTAYSNLIMVTSGDEEQYSWDNQFTELWNNNNHRSSCIRNIFQMNKQLVSWSNPTIFDGSPDDDHLSTTLSGAPCNIYPPLTDSELADKYQGCNNVASWLWFQTKVSNATATPSLSSANHSHVDARQSYH